ncbi:FhaA domain-containing protein [Thermophilibacter immobilis]|jgi:hypothetical protein|uniref:DUF3662 and FHA domain-containing protein n=1 Tax=Thermophilibacter immobilis TaxID=2779519 RepID=A0A7S7M8C5_9ACTN|nr:DUF3662 and FHA domain-containing protein [Thermophilibacter immobilis]QOY60612.1 DUF3662 and FHA domain-containing protein [Thermophilibacter immobilis]
MSFLSDFEGRIGSVFGAAPQGYTEPFSFKKLAKRAAREMENETYEIDGVDTAPALYTVLVSSSDDALMRPLYEQITYEISTLMTAQAQKKNYAFVGNPLVRFMVDPSLKSGKFAVFAENVDSRTLTRLREEERAFLGGNSSVGGAAAQIQRRGPQPQASRPARHEEAPLSTPLVTPASVPFSDTDAGLGVVPGDFDEPLPVASASASTPMPVAVANAPVVAEGARPMSIPVPQTQRRNVPLVDPHHAAAQTSTESPAAYAAPVVETSGHGVADVRARASASAPRATCLLIDRQTGRTFTGTAPSAVIGRERSQAQIVLRDPNVSRRHAELSFDGRDWHVTDLNSTNGTLVNDVDVTDCVLRDGDLLTVGLVNLEFRENLQ